MVAAADIVLIVSIVLLGLSAGLFFGFSVAVMPGLLTVGDSVFVATMNSINRAILNPVFFLVFVGAVLGPAAAAVLAFLGGDPVQGILAAAATLVYVIGVLAVTARVNVPLNDSLARNGDRQAYEPRWVRFNTVRTWSSLVAFVLGVVALAL